jgi:Xaa-Pro aminopeptidase
MRKDLDALMIKNDLDAIIVIGPAKHNPAMYYLTGGAHITNAVLIKKRDTDPTLFYNPMERDEAASTGLPTKNLSDYRFNELLAECDGDQLKALILRYQKMLEDVDLTSGRVAIYGNVDAGAAYATFSGLQKTLPELIIIGELSNSVLMQAMATKENDEIERIRNMGKITTSVVGQVADFLTSHRVIDETLINTNDTPLTIGDVKNQINLWLAELGAENPEGTILAIGRDAGVPHSSGNAQDHLRLGQTIIFDIFPCEEGGGYFYDFTRTWCIGYAPDDVQAVYDDVLDVYSQIMSELKANTPCKPYQDRTCELFEAKGHPTIKSDPQTQEGYVHSLGHGLGLHVHESPWFGQTATEDDQLDPGVVITIEPGLYYPDRGLGVRLEDTVQVRSDGNIEILAEYPLDLVLPIK